MVKQPQHRTSDKQTDGYVDGMTSSTMSGKLTAITSILPNNSVSGYFSQTVQYAPRNLATGQLGTV